MRAHALGPNWSATLLVGITAWILAELSSLGAIAPQGMLIASTTLLLVYLVAEMYRLRRISPNRWLLSPIVLCSVVTFIIGFGIANLLYFFPEDVLLSLGVTPNVTSWMNKLMLLVVVGALAMWLGYCSRLATVMSTWLLGQRWLDGMLRRDFRVRPMVLAALVLASLASRLVEINLGIYGYSADYDRLIELAPIRQYLYMIDGLGHLALVVASLQFYSPDAPPRAKGWFLGVLVYELFFGFLTGFKYQVAIPFVIVGLCKYLRQGIVSRRWIMLFAAAIFVAYAVIEPFRALRYEDSGFRGNSLTSISSTLLTATAGNGAESVDDEQMGTGLLFLSRMSMTYIGSLGIEFADTRPLPPGSPAFLRDIFLAPLYAAIPRALWTSKESSRHGLWYWNEVMGIDTPDAKTAVGMSPFTYLYFAGGGLAVALGFFALGVAQRVWTERFLQSDAAGALLIFLLGLRILSVPDNVYYTTIVDLLRIIPAALVLQYWVFRR